ncbi:pentapeptide repeat-containing protein [Polaribacter sp.]|uniref:pentapeptide repeat-containing protein n=1 Tax=Polaribacter sp. TaxID=1920175 RepID=UPI003F6AE5D9
MKHKITLLTLSLFLTTTFSFAQKTIEASDIMQDIKDGKNISYKNATIVGVLDFTYMDDALEKLPKRKKKSGWFNWNSNNYSTNQVKKMIDVNISFVNCIFKNDVLAYIPHEDSGYTFTASFEDNAIFKNCNFERKAMFKYSRFESNTDFSGSSFDDDTTFKYAKFDDEISFANTAFDETATFKYAKFSNNVSFSNALFKDSATFKYTKFYDGVSFENTKFEEDLNIKYTQVSGDFIITNMDVAYEIDSKYTKINGKSFSKYLIDKK